MNSGLWLQSLQSHSEELADELFQGDASHGSHLTGAKGSRIAGDDKQFKQIHS